MYFPVSLTEKTPLKGYLIFRCSASRVAIFKLKQLVGIPGSSSKCHEKMSSGENCWRFFLYVHILGCRSDPKSKKHQIRDPWKTVRKTYHLESHPASCWRPPSNIPHNKDSPMDRIRGLQEALHRLGPSAESTKLTDLAEVKGPRG